MTASQNVSVDGDTFAGFIRAEERRFGEWLERLIKNGIEDKEAAAELVAITNRHDVLAKIQRGYLRG